NVASLNLSSATQTDPRLIRRSHQSEARQNGLVPDASDNTRIPTHPTTGLSSACRFDCRTHTPCVFADHPHSSASPVSSGCRCLDAYPLGWPITTTCLPVS